MGRPFIGDAVPLQIPGADGRDTRPQPCSLLSIGQAFTGTHKFSNLRWRISVCIQGLDFGRGYLCGTSKSLDDPMTPMETFWEGEIIDTKNYTFYTGKWETTSDEDIMHWSKFASFAQFKALVETDDGGSLDLSNHEHIYMRWKDQYFVNDGSIDVSGFYYVCFSCVDGSINGYNRNPNCIPFQNFEIKNMNEGRSIFSSSSYEFQ